MDCNLFAYDPTDINVGDNKDENSPEVDTIFAGPKEASCAEEVTGIAIEEVNRRFDHELLADADESGYEAIGEEVRRALHLP